MDRIVVTMCGVWFWLTRRRRIRAYSSAAYTLTLAHARLQREFYSQASTRDRGTLLPGQLEALGILESHAVSTYQWASRFDSLRECCRYVSGELRPPAITAPRKAPVPALRPHLVGASLRSSSIWDSSRILAKHPLTGFRRIARTLDATTLWARTISTLPLRRSRPALSTGPAEQQPLPLKAA